MQSMKTPSTVGNSSVRDVATSQDSHVTLDHHTRRHLEIIHIILVHTRTDTQVPSLALQLWDYQRLGIVAPHLAGNCGP